MPPQPGPEESITVTDVRTKASVPIESVIVHDPSGWVETYMGEKFHITRPSPDAICIDDIAHALSNQCRFNGHCKTFYSVAEHSVLMAQRHLLYTPDDHTLLLAMLLHDAAEAYLGDFCRGVKIALPVLKTVEKSIQDVIWEHYKIPEESYTDPRIDNYDKRILLDERRHLFSPATRHIWGNENLEPLWIKIESWNPEEAKKQFLCFFWKIETARRLAESPL